MLCDKRGEMWCVLGNFISANVFVFAERSSTRMGPLEAGYRKLSKK